MAHPWILSAAQRNDTATRVAASLMSCCLAHSRGREIGDALAYEQAVAIEKKAYNAAQVVIRAEQPAAVAPCNNALMPQVGSMTTTNAWDSGSRPASENTKAYARQDHA